VGQGLLTVDASHSHSDALHLVGHLWTSDQPDAENSTWQHTTLTRDRLPRARRDSNPQSQQAKGRRLTSLTARPPGVAKAYVFLSYIHKWSPSLTENTLCGHYKDQTLMMFRYNAGVYCENHTRHIYTGCIYNAWKNFYGKFFTAKQTQKCVWTYVRKSPQMHETKNFKRVVNTLTF